MFRLQSFGFVRRSLGYLNILMPGAVPKLVVRDIYVSGPIAEIQLVERIREDNNMSLNSEFYGALLKASFWPNAAVRSSGWVSAFRS